MMKVKIRTEQADGYYGGYHRWLKRSTNRHKRRQLKKLMTAKQYEDVTPEIYKKYHGWES